MLRSMMHWYRRTFLKPKGPDLTLDQSIPEPEYVPDDMYCPNKEVYNFAARMQGPFVTITVIKRNPNEQNDLPTTYVVPAAE